MFTFKLLLLHSTSMLYNYIRFCGYFFFHQKFPSCRNVIAAASFLRPFLREKIWKVVCYSLTPCQNSLNRKAHLSGYLKPISALRSSIIHETSSVFEVDQGGVVHLFISTWSRSERTKARRAVVPEFYKKERQQKKSGEGGNCANCLSGLLTFLRIINENISPKFSLTFLKR